LYIKNSANQFWAGVPSLFACGSSETPFIPTKESGKPEAVEKNLRDEIVADQDTSKKGHNWRGEGMVSRGEEVP
jgi:hypothetical protein